MTIKEERKKDHVCLYCGGMLDREGVHCEKCIKLHNEWKRIRILKLHEEGKCSTCGKKLDREGWFCILCAKKLNDRGKIRNVYRRANNLCPRCGESSIDYIYCQKCRDARMELYWKKKAKKEGDHIGK